MLTSNFYITPSNMLHTFTLKMKHMTLKQWNYLAMWDVIILEVRVEQWNPGQS